LLFITSFKSLTLRTKIGSLAKVLLGIGFSNKIRLGRCIHESVNLKKTYGIIVNTASCSGD
jgi:hypothetical protein